MKPCGCRQWETSGGDTETIRCPQHLFEDGHCRRCSYCGELVDVNESRVTDEDRIICKQCDEDIEEIY